MPSYESSMRNLEKARSVDRPPRPWRSGQESQTIRLTRSYVSRSFSWKDEEHQTQLSAPLAHAFAVGEKA
jgi:hypothetical protein